MSLLEGKEQRGGSGFLDHSDKGVKQKDGNPSLKLGEFECLLSGGNCFRVCEYMMLPKGV